MQEVRGLLRSTEQIGSPLKFLQAPTSGRLRPPLAKIMPAPAITATTKWCTHTAAIASTSSLVMMAGCCVSGGGAAEDGYSWGKLHYEMCRMKDCDERESSRESCLWGAEHFSGALSSLPVSELLLLERCLHMAIRILDATVVLLPWGCSGQVNLTWPLITGSVLDLGWAGFIRACHRGAPHPRHYSVKYDNMKQL
jgi:hypothetical protein